MWSYIWPLLLVVGANTFYHICAKGTPGDLHPFASLTVTYLTAAVLSMLLFFTASPSRNLLLEVKKVRFFIIKNEKLSIF